MTDIHVSNVSLVSRRAAVGWTDGDDRFHFWIDIDTLEIERAVGHFSHTSGTIYKNPAKANRGEPGHYETRKLDAGNTKNEKIVLRVLEAVRADDLVAKAIKAQQEAEVEAEQSRKRKVIDDRRESLRSILAEMRQHDHDAMIDEISEALSMDDIDELQRRLP